jgi:glutamine synthetase
MLGAGLKGIEQELPLAPEATNNIFHMTDEELEAAGIKTLPGTLGEAIDKFEASALMKEVLGDHIHSFYVENKRAEWDEYRLQVSEWEIRKYLPVV